MLNRPEVENHLDQTLLHRILVGTERLGQLPPSMVVGSLLINAVVVGVVWLEKGTTTALSAILLMLLISGVNYWMLSSLPRNGRSWGNYKASLLILSAFQALVLALFGLLGAALWLPILLIALLSGVIYYATWIEPFRLGVTHQTYHRARKSGEGESNYPKDIPRPYTILHISDLHLERISPRERKLNQLIRMLQPDLIVFTGDFVNISFTYDKTAEDDIRQIIGDWKAPLGVYCVPGTPAVEPLDRVAAFTRGLEDVHVLLNRWKTIETSNATPNRAPTGTLHILGLVTTHDMQQDRAAFSKALQSAPKSDGIKLLLAHSPDLAPEASAAGFDLYFCGHTHGGQLRLPLIGAFFTGSHYGMRYAMGRYDVQGMQLYVTRGLGMEGFGAPRARLLCPPEIALWEIKH